MIRTLLLLVLMSCGASEREGHDGHDAHDEAPGAPEDDGHDAPDVLEVSEDLRRDLRISTALVTGRAGQDAITALGELRLVEDAEAILAAPAAARISAVRVRPGDRVTRGQPLIELQSAGVGEARAALLRAEAGLLSAEASLARKRALGAEVVSQAELEGAEAAQKIAQAEHRAARAALGALGAGEEADPAMSARLVLRAPIDGTVLSRAATVGQVVPAEETLLRLGNLVQLQVEVHAFERDAARLRPGDPAEVELSALPGRLLAATVARVGAEVEVQSRTVPVRLDLAEVADLRPGMAATARLPVPGDRVSLMAPAAALQRSSGGWVVFVPEEDHFRVRPVGRGRDLGSDVEILSGLSDGDSVVVEGAFLLKAELEKRAGGGGHHDH